MSDCKDQLLDSTLGIVSSKLHVCLFSTHPQFADSVKQSLNSDRYELKCLSIAEEVVDFVAQNKEQIDCIILVNSSHSDSILKKLWQSEILLPIVIIETEQSICSPGDTDQNSAEDSTDIAVVDIVYHQAEIRLYPTQILEINSYISLAITKFLSLTPDSEIHCAQPDNNKNPKNIAKKSLIVQQRRLTNKIKERLGYLGVYYKRDTKDFYRNLSSDKQEEFSRRLSNAYRQILLEYFEDSENINQLIDEFVDRAFFADVSTSQILEVHMSLIDDFSYQLQIEGRNDDILLDYRLPLIDVVSHLCEMYRRSIPGEDISLDLLFGVK